MGLKSIIAMFTTYEVLEFSTAFFVANENQT